MHKLDVQNGLIYFYGNTVGYVEDKQAVVDQMFNCDELTDFLSGDKDLSVEWRTGVFDRLSNNGCISRDAGKQERLKDCRIWQLKPGIDPTIRFIGYDDLRAMDGSPEPDCRNYRVVFDGQIETNDLDEIYGKFDVSPAWGDEGNPISISDVIELYDNQGSEFHYVDRRGFVEISFGVQQTQDRQMAPQNGPV